MTAGVAPSNSRKLGLAGTRATMSVTPLAIVLLATLSVIALGYGVRGRRVTHSLRCLRCRYDLSGTPDASCCPECGGSLGSSVNATRSSRVRSRAHCFAIAAGTVLGIASASIVTMSLLNLSVLDAVPLKGLLWLADTPARRNAHFSQRYVVAVSSAARSTSERATILAWITADEPNDARMLALKALLTQPGNQQSEYSDIAGWAARHVLMPSAARFETELLETMYQAIRVGGTIPPTLLRDVCMKMVAPALVLVVPEWTTGDPVSTLSYTSRAGASVPIEVLLIQVESNGGRVLEQRREGWPAFASVDVSTLDQLPSSGVIEVMYAFRIMGSPTTSASVSSRFMMPSRPQETMSESATQSAFDAFVADQYQCSALGTRRLPSAIRHLRGTAGIDGEEDVQTSQIRRFDPERGVVAEDLVSMSELSVRAPKGGVTCLMLTYRITGDGAEPVRAHLMQDLASDQASRIGTECWLPKTAKVEHTDMFQPSVDGVDRLTMRLMAVHLPPAEQKWCKDGPAVRWRVVRPMSSHGDSQGGR